MADDLQDLARRAGERMQQRSLMVATAESCTGGWVAACLTAVAGSSAWFERGFVTYSNDAKQEALGVSRDTLDAHGAVSEPVAREMVVGALRHSRAQVAVAVTGIAGPSGGTPEKPVGTVCFAWAGPGDAISSRTLHFAGDREQVRRQSVAEALTGVLRLADALG
jgi:nicotinamide-nucleotide amidase